MNKQKLIFISLLLIALAALAGYRLCLQEAAGSVYTGTVEVTTADVTAKTNGYLKSLSLKEGDAVAKGQIVASLDRADLTAQLARDTAALSKAKAELADLEKGARPQEIKEALANTAACRSVFEKACADYRRFQALYQEGAIAAQQLDDARSSKEVAQNNLSAAEEKHNLLAAGSRADTIEAQRQEVARTAAALNMTQVAAGDTTIRAPLNGLVLTKNYESGEYISAGSPIATLADLNDCWVKIYVPSDQLGLIHAGQAASVIIDAFPSAPFQGAVKEISDTAEFTPRQSITKNERANMVFAVKIRVDNSSGRLKPGMPADVIFDD